MKPIESGEMVAALIAAYPQGLREIDSPRRGRLPLHMALESLEYTTIPSPTIISILIEQDPGTVAIRNGRAQLPIHIAVDEGAPLSIVEALVKVYPQALAEPSVWNVYRRPLHLAVQTGTHTPVPEIVEFLAIMSPQAIETMDSLGLTPFALAANGDAAPAVLRTLRACERRVDGDADGMPL